MKIEVVGARAHRRASDSAARRRADNEAAAWQGVAA